MKKNISFLLTVHIFLFIIMAAVSFAAGPLIEKDYSIAGLNIKDSLEKVKSVIGPLELVNSYTNEIANCKVNVYEAKGVQVSIALYDGGHVWSIEVFSREYPTTLGIKVGDSIKNLQEIYGEPSYKDSFEDKNGKNYLYWFYDDMKKMKRLMFKIDKDKNVIYSITSGKIID
jgi:hypothetical protein